MIKLAFLRHGNTFEKGETSRYVGSRTDLELTKDGIRQAEEASEKLRQRGFVPDLIIHGPLKRQKQTALAASKALNISSVIEDSALSEIDYGPWENLTEEEILKRWPSEFQNYKERGLWPELLFPTKEADQEAKLHSWLARVKSAYDGRSLLAVSSNGVLRTFRKIIEKDSFDHTKAKVKTGGLCLLEVLDSGAIKILEWNV